MGMMILPTGCAFKTTEDIVNEQAMESFALELKAITPSEVTQTNEIIYTSLSEDQKCIYNKLLDGYMNFETAIGFNTSEDDIKLAHKALIADHPEIFYVNGFVTDSSKGLFGITINQNELTLYPNYTYSMSEAKSAKSEIDDQVNILLSDHEGIMDTSDYEKSKVAFDVITKNVLYSSDVEHSQTIAAAFIRGKSVCGGYAQAYSYLMQLLNVPCTVITGELEDVSHSWCVSILDGQFYMTDPTNGDSYYNLNDNKMDYIDYSFLNIDPTFMPEYIPSEMFKNFTTNATDNNYYIKEDQYITQFNEAQISAVIKKAKAASMPYVTFRVVNESLETAKNNLLDLQAMQNKYDVTHTKLLDDFGTITLYFNGAENTVKQED